MTRILSASPWDTPGRRFFILGLVTKTLRLLDFAREMEYFIKVDTSEELMVLFNFTDDQWESWIAVNEGGLNDR